MKVLFLFIMLFISIQGQSQSCIERVHKVGLKYFSIPDKKYFEDIDSIRFIISNPINPLNPTILFLQGSGNTPILSYKDSINFYNFPFPIGQYLDKYNFVYISKPATPICSERKEFPVVIDTTFPDIITFSKMDFLDYYVDQVHQVINYLNMNILSQNTAIFLIGYSQGAGVAIKYASLYEDNIKKIVLCSGGILDRYSQDIFYWRQLADCMKISSEEAQRQINIIYERYANIKKTTESQKDNSKLFNRNDLINYYQVITDYSYNFPIPLGNLLKINIPILCAYGTDDLKSRDNDLLPLYFIREEKSNLTMLPMINCDHSFVKRTINEESQQIKEEYVGDEVFAEIEEWLSM